MYKSFDSPLPSRKEIDSPYLPGVLLGTATPRTDQSRRYMSPNVNMSNESGWPNSQYPSSASKAGRVGGFSEELDPLATSSHSYILPFSSNSHQSTQASNTSNKARRVDVVDTPPVTSLFDMASGREEIRQPSQLGSTASLQYGSSPSDSYVREESMPMSISPPTVATSQVSSAYTKYYDQNVAPTPLSSKPSVENFPSSQWNQPLLNDPRRDACSSINIDSDAADREFDTHVVIFGFPINIAPLVVQYFQSLGEIIFSEQSSVGNWMILQYATRLQAQKALNKNGRLMDVGSDQIMVGVVPLKQASHIYKKLKNVEAPNSRNQYMTSAPFASPAKPSLSSIVPVSTPGLKSYKNVPGAAMSTPLNTTGPFSSNPNKRPLEVEVSQPLQRGLVGRISDYLFGW